MIGLSNEMGIGDQAGRLEVLVRDRGILEGRAPELRGQALVPFLNSCSGSLDLVDAAWQETGHQLDAFALPLQDVVWVRALDPRVPLTELLPGEAVRDRASVEIVLADGEVIHGELTLDPGQFPEDSLEAAGVFIPLWADRLEGKDRALGTFGVATSAIRFSREITPTSVPTDGDLGITLERAIDSAVKGRSGIQGGNREGPSGLERQLTGAAAPAAPTAPAAPAAPAAVVSSGTGPHRLVVAARRWGLPGAEHIRISTATPLAQVWEALAQAASMTTDDLAAFIGQRLHMPSADLARGGPELSASLMALETKYGVRVTGDDGRILYVATSDPLDDEAEQTLGFTAGRRVVFQVAAPHALGLDPAPRPEPEDLDRVVEFLPWSGEDAVRVEQDDEPEEIEVGEASAAPIVELADAILREAVRQGASDIHLDPTVQRGVVRFQVHGVLRPYMHIPLTALNGLVSRYKIMARLDIADRIRPQDGQVRVNVDGERFELRLSTVPTQNSEKAVIRLASSTQEETLDQVSIPAPELARIKELLSCRDGMIVVTGPKGSGKTTTLYAALREISRGDLSIVTIEDPVERTLAGATQIQVQDRRGVTFAAALRAVLRQDPDVILVGEIRDEETGKLAIQAAMTGHLVLTTLHTTTAVGAVARLRDLGLEPAALAATLRGVVAQRLARRTCQACAGEGCRKCANEGFRGKIPVMEVLSVDAGFADLVGRDQLPSELQAAAVKAGMRTMRKVAEELVANGETTEPEVLRILGDVQEEMQAPALAGGEPLLSPADEYLNQSGQLNTISAEEVAREPVPDNRGVLEVPAGVEFASALATASDEDEVLEYACQQIGLILDAPLVWSATPEAAGLRIRSHTGVWLGVSGDEGAPSGTLMDPVEEGGAVAAALHLRTPQGGRLEDQPGLLGFRAGAVSLELGGFLALPVTEGKEVVALMGVHTAGHETLDDARFQAVEKVLVPIAAAIRRVRQLSATEIQLAAFESTEDAVIIADRMGVIQWVNSAFLGLTGYSPVEVVGRSTGMLRSDRHDMAFHKEVASTVLSGRSWRGEMYNRRKDGSIYPIEQTVTPIVKDGKAASFIAVQRDISARKEREEALLRLVANDSDTGLPNWSGFMIELESQVERSRGGAVSSLLLAHPRRDLLGAHFSAAGSEVGDFRRRFVEHLEETLGAEAFIAHLGDGEFAAILPDTSRVEALRIADRLGGSTCDGVPPLMGKANAIGWVSVGVAEIDGSTGAKGALALAKEALFRRSDESGRIRADVGEGAVSGGVEEWTRRIRKAQEEDRFFLHFQPVVRLSTGEVDHFSALLRLFEVDGSTAPARAFIGHAEESGLISELDQWVVQQAIQVLLESPELRLSVNMHPDTIRDEGFRGALRRQRAQLQSVSGRLTFEVPVSGDVGTIISMSHPMAELEELGCRFILDNVGIGAGSITAIGALTAHAVKLDRGLIRGLDGDTNRQDLVQALVEVSHALGREVIAAGAETGSIVALLPELGVDLAEGHHLGHPGAAPGGSEGRRRRESPVQLMHAVG